MQKHPQTSPNIVLFLNIMGPYGKEKRILPFFDRHPHLHHKNSLNQYINILRNGIEKQCITKDMTKEDLIFGLRLTMTLVGESSVNPEGTLIEYLTQFIQPDVQQEVQSTHKSKMIDPLPSILFGTGLELESPGLAARREDVLLFFKSMNCLLKSNSCKTFHPVILKFIHDFIRNNPWNFVKQSDGTMRKIIMNLLEAFYLDPNIKKLLKGPMGSQEKNEIDEVKESLINCILWSQRFSDRLSQSVGSERLQQATEIFDQLDQEICERFQEEKDDWDTKPSTVQKKEDESDDKPSTVKMKSAIEVNNTKVNALHYGFLFAEQSSPQGSSSAHILHDQADSGKITHSQFELPPSAVGNTKVPPFGSLNDFVARAFVERLEDEKTKEKETSLTILSGLKQQPESCCLKIDAKDLGNSSSPSLSSIFDACSLNLDDDADSSSALSLARNIMSQMESSILRAQ